MIRAGHYRICSRQRSSEYTPRAEGQSKALDGTGHLMTWVAQSGTFVRPGFQGSMHRRPSASRIGGNDACPRPALAGPPARLVEGQDRTLDTFSSSRSEGRTSNAWAICQIVSNVAFCSPRSMLLTKARSTPMRSATASWLKPRVSRNRRAFAPKTLRISIRRIGSNRVFWRYVL